MSLLPPALEVTLSADTKPFVHTFSVLAGLAPAFTITRIPSWVNLRTQQTRGKRPLRSHWRRRK